MNDVPVFDFDGVICDASCETLLVTWLAEPHSAPRDVADAARAVIPSGFTQAFLHCRAYARHVGHLAVTFHPGIVSVRTQREFDALYAGLEPADVEHFTRRFEAYRRRFRESACDRWLAAHRLYPGIAALLHERVGDFYVVTAKDRDSVLAVLAHHRVSVDRHRILGSCRDKLSAYRDCEARARRRNLRVSIVDDNVPNVIAAAADGFDAYWAEWGYHTREHVELACAMGLRRLSLDDLTARGSIFERTVRR